MTTLSKQTIIDQLRQIEQEEQVRILYACESGSRAWGFPSRDSDYDVRFIYIRPPHWYLSLFEKKDVIERPIHGLLDINGWDLQKALRLFYKSNPPLLEWLQSPIRYWERYTITEQIRQRVPLTFSPKSCMHHYLSMAKRNFRQYVQADQVKVKKYFYVLRPVLACCWIIRFESMPPTQFEMLVDELIPPRTELSVIIAELLRRKKAGDELAVQPQIKPIHHYLEQQISELEQAAGQIATVRNDGAGLDQLFLAALREVWSWEEGLTDGDCTIDVH